jgi:hypothetical protein
MTKSTKTIVHSDNTVSYWSVYRQVRVRRALNVPECELFSMTEKDRERVIAALNERIAED